MSSPADPAPPAAQRRRARTEYRLFADLLSLFLALPIGAIGLIVRFGPAGENDFGVAGALVLPLAVAAIIAGAAAFRFVFTSPRPTRFAISLGAAISGFVVASIALGTIVHRDFFTAAFQYLVGALIALMYRLATRPKSSLAFSPSSLRALSKAGIVVSVFYVEWIMLMGYAISTRAEPRPVESILYNVYNLAQVLILFVTSRWVERNTLHTVRVEADELDVDGRDIVPVLGHKKADIFRGFVLAPDRRLRCSEVQGLFREESEDPATDRCSSCNEQTTKVALCAKYRNTYNCILELKRVLEFLEIGTITAPENKRHILTDGWKLALFENTRLLIRRK